MEQAPIVRELSSSPHLKGAGRFITLGSGGLVYGRIGDGSDPTRLGVDNL